MLVAAKNQARIEAKAPLGGLTIHRAWEKPTKQQPARTRTATALKGTPCCPVGSGGPTLCKVGSLEPKPEPIVLTDDMTDAELIKLGMISKKDFSFLDEFHSQLP